MNSFWFWLILLGTSWGLAITQLSIDIVEMPLYLIGSAIFFALFFLSPLFRKNKYMYSINFFVMAIIAFFTLLPESNATIPNPYTLLVFTILAGKAVFRLNGKSAIVTGLLIYILNLLPYFLDLSSFSIYFLTLYGVMLG